MTMLNEPTKFPEPQPVATIQTERQIASIRFSPCGNFLFAAGRDAKIHRWDLTRPEPPIADASAPDNKKGGTAPPPEPVFPELPALTGHDGWVSSIVVASQGERLISADSWGRLICWRYTDKMPVPIWNVADAHDGWIRQLAVGPDGQQLATCGMDGRIRLWSTDDGTKQRELGGPGGDVFSLAFHPDGKSLVAGDLKGIITQWDLAEGKPVRDFDAKIFYKLSYIQDVGGVRWLAFDADGKTLTAAGGQPDSGGFVQAIPTLRFFNWADGKETQTVKLGDLPDGFVHEIAYHPQGYWIGVCSGQPGRGKYFLHRAGEEHPFFTNTKPLPNCHSVALYPKGERFAVISNAGTFGQQKSKACEGIYPGNTSPIHLFDVDRLRI
jgi:WD40 repeat protein